MIMESRHKRGRRTGCMDPAVPYSPQMETPATRPTLPGSDSFSKRHSAMEAERDEDMRKSPRNQA